MMSTERSGGQVRGLKGMFWKLEGLERLNIIRSGRQALVTRWEVLGVYW